jgi:hypothetical protein
MSAKTYDDRCASCPSCGKLAERVSPLTVRTLVKQQYAEAFAGVGGAFRSVPGDPERGCRPTLSDSGWRFCNSQNCDVVYFAEVGDARFTTPQIKVAVGVKETTGRRPLCYCFGHSIASIKFELQTKGRSDAVEDIRRKMSDRGCRCEIENPSGTCCLRAVTQGTKAAWEELQNG